MHRSTESREILQLLVTATGGDEEGDSATAEYPKGEENGPRRTSVDSITTNTDIWSDSSPDRFNMSSQGRTPIFQIGEMETSESNASTPTETVHFVFPDVNSASGGDGGDADTSIGRRGSHSKSNNNSGGNLLIAKPGFFGGHYYNSVSPRDRSFSSPRHSIDGQFVEIPQRNVSTSSSEGGTNDGNRLWAFTRRQWLTLVVFAFVEFFSAIVISLQAPFYPREAEKKGATATEYGFVFGIFELTAFIVSPIYGAYMSQIGPKLVFNAGIFITATCSILFGFLDRIEMRVEFISLSMLTRIFEAVGDAGFVTASFVIIATEFPESVATTFATMETFYGLGLIVGPTVGGFLYQLGGYTLPFITIGGVLLTAAFMTYFVLPSSLSVEDYSDETDGKQSPLDIFRILSVPTIAMSAFTIVTAALSIGYLSATLEPHLRQFGLTPVVTGLMFIASGGCYAITAPVWGFVCDKIAQLNFVMLIGSILIIIGFLLIGPAPFIPLQPNLSLVITGLVIHGVGLGAALVAGFVQSLREAISHGFPDNISTYGVVSSIWTSMFALGSFIGPCVAGVLFDNVGFSFGTMFVVGAQLVAVVFAFFFILNCYTTPVIEEMEPLLPSLSPSTLEDTEDRRLSTSYGTTTKLL